MAQQASQDQEIADFERRCMEAWGTLTRDQAQLVDPRLSRVVDIIDDYENVSDLLKVHIAEKLLTESCSIIGAYTGSGDICIYLRYATRELRDRGHFKGRRLMPLRAALLLVANRRFQPNVSVGLADIDIVYDGGSAVASIYLLAQLEHLFRTKGEYLDGQGCPTRRTMSKALLRHLGWTNPLRRVNQIGEAFRIYLWGNRREPAKRLRRLDRHLRITGRLSVSDRLNKVRHPAVHGELSDAHGESMFYGLLLCMFYYSERP